MTRPLVFGNGNIFVSSDTKNRIRDFYYPYVGQENHVSGNIHHTGIYVDGKMSWLSDDSWKWELRYKKDSLVSEVKAKNHSLKLEIEIEECVHYDKNIFLKSFKIINKSSEKRELRVFFNHRFSISEANIGDTVYYDPIQNAIVNYKGKVYFMIRGICENKNFDDYSTGNASVYGKEGTHIDAESGDLSKNPIEHGSVDSTIGFSISLNKGSNKKIECWICVGENYEEVTKLNSFVNSNGLSNLILETDNHWKKWANKQNFVFFDLKGKVKDLFKRSLLTVKVNEDRGGAVIAANDSDTLYFKKDTYSYMWPRDGALIIRSLDRVGHKNTTARFFNFCKRVIEKDGYLFHKYRPDGSRGSSWHSWLKYDKIQLPIQEDETALVLDALWKSYDQYKDKKFFGDFYKTLIKPAGDFMVNYRDKKTKLPKESYDLWEEKLGVHTFTCCTAYAGLYSAHKFAKIFGNKKDADKYKKAADELREGILKYLYDEEKGVFIKGIHYDKDGNMIKDFKVDISTGYGIFEYNILDVNDEKVINTMELIRDKLWVHEGVGGMKRYEKDSYYRIPESKDGNPWFISTLWLAEYYIAKAKNKKDISQAEYLLDWCADYSASTGVLSEQIHPYTGEPLSVSPLTWSHAGFVIATMKYLDKIKSMGLNTKKVSNSAKNKSKNNKSKK